MLANAFRVERSLTPRGSISGESLDSQEEKQGDVAMLL